MNPALTSWIAPGALFLLTLASGVWVSRIGRPINGLVLTLHKLIALTVVIWAGAVWYVKLRGADVTVLAIALVAVAGAAVVALFATGALLSQTKPARRVLLGMHQAAPVLAVLSTAAAAILLTAGR